MQIRQCMIEPAAERPVDLHGIGAAGDGLAEGQLHVGGVLLRRERKHFHPLGHVSQRVEVADGQIGRAADSRQGCKAPVHGDDGIEGTRPVAGGKLLGTELRGPDEGVRGHHFSSSFQGEPESPTAEPG